MAHISCTAKTVSQEDRRCCRNTPPQPVHFGQTRPMDESDFFFNPVAERWIGSCRRELLEHVVVFGQRHLVRLVASYITYYHADRCHLGLDKDAPGRGLPPRRKSSHRRVLADFTVVMSGARRPERPSLLVGFHLVDE